MLGAEILHGACPVNIRQQAGITQAEAFYGLAGGHIEDFFQRGLRSLGDSTAAGRQQSPQTALPKARLQ